jgi:hypothetical protein
MLDAKAIKNKIAVKVSTRFSSSDILVSSLMRK